MAEIQRMFWNFLFELDPNPTNKKKRKTDPELVLRFTNTSVNMPQTLCLARVKIDKHMEDIDIFF